MHQFSTAFFMAWGNFLNLPCPHKVWDGKLKNLMLSLLPLVGLIIGILLFAAAWLCQIYARSTPDSSLSLFFPLFLTFLLYWLAGFFHMDGFMDVNDALLSRRPLPERQKILKDSHVGSFAVITVIFLLGATVTSFFAILKRDLPMYALTALLLIPAVSRGISGACVLLFPTLSTSQYEENHHEPRGKYVLLDLILLLLISCGIFLLVIFLFNPTQKIRLLLYPGVPAGMTALCTYLFALRGRIALGGMGGDIAGYAICTGELAGLITAVFMINMF